MSHHASRNRMSTRSTSNDDVGRVRLQAAVIRTLLDELDQFGPSLASGGQVLDQIAEELQRLGREALRAAAIIERSRSADLEEPAEEERIPHWLPLAF
jgi:hypothetical protein